MMNMHKNVPRKKSDQNLVQSHGVVRFQQVTTIDSPPQWVSCHREDFVSGISGFVSVESEDRLQSNQMSVSSSSQARALSLQKAGVDLQSIRIWKWREPTNRRKMGRRKVVELMPVLFLNSPCLVKIRPAAEIQ